MLWVLYLWLLISIMIKWWVECASLTIFKGKYHNQVDQSCGYNQDAGDRVKPVGSTTHFIKHSLCRNCYSLNVYSTTESFNIQVNVQLINSLAEGLSIRHCFDLIVKNLWIKLCFSTWGKGSRSFGSFKYCHQPARRTQDPNLACFKVKAHP